MMAAANRSLWPVIAPALGTGGLGEAWQACTTLREHRGDGHVAALLAHGVGGVEAHLLAAGTKGIPAEVLRDNRGWSEEDWGPAAADLAARGLLHADGRATDAGRTLHGEVEDLTDRLAEPAYAALSDGALEDLHGALSRLCRRRGRLGPGAVPQPDGAAPPAVTTVPGPWIANSCHPGRPATPNTGVMRTTIESYKQRAGRLGLEGIEFDDFRDRPLAPEALRSLRYMHDVEHHTVCYLRDLLLTPAHRDPDITSFLSCWVFEEMWHGEAIGAGARGPRREAGAPRIAALRHGRRRRQEAISTLSTIGSAAFAGRAFTALHMTWGAINEWTTQAGYARLSDKADHPTLRELLKPHHEAGGWAHRLLRLRGAPDGSPRAPGRSGSPVSRSSTSGARWARA